MEGEEQAKKDIEAATEGGHGEIKIVVEFFMNDKNFSQMIEGKAEKHCCDV